MDNAMVMMATMMTVGDYDDNWWHNMSFNRPCWWENQQTFLLRSLRYDLQSSHLKFCHHKMTVCSHHSNPLEYKMTNLKILQLLWLKSHWKLSMSTISISTMSMSTCPCPICLPYSWPPCPPSWHPPAPHALQKYNVHFVFEALYICLCLCLGICLWNPALQKYNTQLSKSSPELNASSDEKNK